MDIKEVKAALNVEPFVPMRLEKTDGTSLDIRFRHVAIPLTDGLMVMEGVKSPTSHNATGYEVVGFDRIQSIRPKRRAAKK